MEYSKAHGLPQPSSFISFALKTWLLKPQGECTEVWGLRWRFRHPPQNIHQVAPGSFRCQALFPFPCLSDQRGDLAALALCSPFGLFFSKKHLRLGLAPAGSGPGCSITTAVLKSSDGAVAKSPKKKCELMPKFDCKSVLLVLDMSSPNRPEVFLLQCHIFSHLFIMCIPKHTTVFQALCWALKTFIPNPHRDLSNQACFFPFLHQ